MVDLPEESNLLGPGKTAKWQKELDDIERKTLNSDVPSGKMEKLYARGCLLCDKIDRLEHAQLFW